MSFLKGHLLVAMPKLTDRNFFRTVSLLVEHGEKGALGVVLNRPSQINIKEVWAQVRGETCALNSPIHFGGPCEGFLTAIHTNSRLSDVRILSGLHFTQTPAALERLVEKRESPIRFFLGFAGWSEGQLESEMDEGSWLTTPATVGDVFREQEDFWAEALRRIAGPSPAATLKIGRLPADLSAN